MPGDLFDVTDGIRKGRRTGRVLLTLGVVMWVFDGHDTGDLCDQPGAPRERVRLVATASRCAARAEAPLINVHVPYEGEIEGTDLLLPFDQVGRSVAKLPADRSAKLVLCCRSGHMSAIAARSLVGLGYTNVWTLEGGMIAWTDEGYRVVHKKR